MTEPRSGARGALPFAAAAVVIALLGAVAGWQWQANRSGGSKTEIEQVVRNYLLEHPEVLPEAMERLRQKETQQQLSSVADDLERPFPGAVLGNPQGRIVLVEFSDYACTYCRRSVADVDALIAANPDLKVVLRELPILSPASTDAAKMALAAAEQSKFSAFHKLMFAAGRPDAQTIEAAARAAGMDLARARRVIADPKIEAELARNLELARALGFDGTPGWVVGEQILVGAVGRERLAEAIAKAAG